jgi:hypothetical protein
MTTRQYLLAELWVIYSLMWLVEAARCLLIGFNNHKRRAG